VVGRAHEDNVKLQELSGQEDFLFKVSGIPGPTGLIVTQVSYGEIELAAAIVAAYSDAVTGDTTVVVVSGEENREVTVNTPPKEEFRELLL